MNSDGRRRRAADTAALKLTELELLISKLSTTTLTCVKCTQNHRENLGMGCGFKLSGKLKTGKVWDRYGTQI